MEHYGIRGIALKWFYSYFSCRKQAVSVSDHSSSLHDISFGVLKRSALGPLLFLIHMLISMISQNCSKLLSFFLFADDTNIYYESDVQVILIRKVNKGLKKVKLWLNSNKLALNVDNTNFVLFHSPRKKLSEYADLKIGKQFIQRTLYESS